VVVIERGGEKGKGIGIREGMERWEGFKESIPKNQFRQST
jgi:hypothetical protein